MNNSDSPDQIEYIRTEGDKDWNNEEIQELDPSLKICCIPLPRRLFLFAKYVAPTLLLLFSFAADIFSGVAVAVRHYKDGDMWWFRLTMIFLCAPAVLFIAHAIIQTISNPNVRLPKKLLWIVLYVFTGAGLLLWPLWGYVTKLYYAVRAFTDEENSTVYLEKLHGSASLNDNLHKMFKAFLQSAPQLLLQMYILLSTPEGQHQDMDTVIAEILSIIFSLNALTIVVVHFEVNSKHHLSQAASAQQSQEVGQLCCVLVEYFWWFFSITARVLALSFFASVFKHWVFVFCAIHAVTISTCLICNHTNYSVSNIVIAICMGFIYIFCFVEYKVDFGMLGKVVGLYVLYYAFTFCQNICMVLSAFFLAEGDYSYHLPIVVVHFVFFFLGIFFMLLYLGVLRPIYLRLVTNKATKPEA